MSSPFLDIPESEWIAHNQHAFAIYDNYPVTRGHALIITHRQVPTWFEATDAEQKAIFDLIAELRQYLKNEFDPDGFNIGVNCGEVAGQTIDHLHVHLIPRYRGDVDDPTGGVRHVIPDRGNYKDNSIENWQESAPGANL